MLKGCVVKKINIKKVGWDFDMKMNLNLSEMKKFFFLVDCLIVNWWLHFKSWGEIETDLSN